MMSSVIPARLEFQCGHAALVSLPRIKGESSPQRNARVAREKSDAQARACDFCAQHMEVVVQAAPPPPVVAPVVRPLAEQLVKPAAPTPPVAPRAAEPVAPPVAAEPVAANGVDGHVSDAPPTPQPVAPVTKPTRAAAKPRVSVKRAMPKPPATRDASARFRVSFVVERIVTAANVSDALRQAARFGATEVLAITERGR